MSELAKGLLAVFQFSNLWGILVGIPIGLIMGAIPGIGASAALAIFLPLTFNQPVTTATLFLISIYVGCEYGGSISAIAINTPGTGGAAASTLDGYPLTQKGLAGKALGASLFAGLCGGTFSAIVLATLAPLLAIFGLKFGPVEMFSLALCGLSIISSLTSGNLIKGFISTLIGLLVAVVGIDPLSGFGRYTFNIPDLLGGVHDIPVMIGLFALAEAFRMLETIGVETENAAEGIISGSVLSLKEFLTLKRATLIGSLIGTWIGIVPGVGTSVASWVSYDAARRSSKTPEQFGKGSLEGVAAPEAANAAVVGGALVPALSLGIPGSASVAVLMGTLIMHGLVPGPFLLRDNPGLVSVIFAGYFVSNFVLLIFGLVGIRAILKILKIPTRILAPSIIAATFLGAYLYNSSYADVVVMYIFGVIGWVFKKTDIPVVPLVIALILGPMVERNLLRGLLISHGSLLVFVTSPISAILLTIAVLTVVYSLKKRPIRSLKRRPMPS